MPDPRTARRIAERRRRKAARANTPAAPAAEAHPSAIDPRALLTRLYALLARHLDIIEARADVRTAALAEARASLAALAVEAEAARAEAAAGAKAAPPPRATPEARPPRAAFPRATPAATLPP